MVPADSNRVLLADLRDHLVEVEPELAEGASAGPR